MKYALLALVPWMAMTAATAQNAVPATVVYTHYGSFSEGFERSDNDCLADPDVLSRWGWHLVLPGEKDVDIYAEGRHARVDWVTNSHGEKTVPLVEVLEQFGASGRWSGNRFIITGRIRTVEIEGHHVSISTTLDAWPKVRYFGRDGADPDRMVLELEGATVSPDAKFALPNGVRIGNFSENVARVVIAKNGAVRIPAPRLIRGRSFDFSTGPVDLGQPLDSTATKPAVNPKPQKDYDGWYKPTTKISSPGAFVLAPATSKIGKGRIIEQQNGDTLLVLPTQGNSSQNPSSQFLDPRTIRVIIPDASLSTDEPLRGAGSGLSKVEFSESGNNAYATLRLSRTMGVKLSRVDNEVRVLLVRPKTSGMLAGKTIVVDAGHGGKDSGANGSGGVREKDLTLSIARNLSRELIEQGANVVMTRDSDVLIDLKERPQIANRGRADLFVSIHINSNNVSSSTGTIIFYHGGETISAALAECLAHEVGKTSELPNLGTRTDTSIYKSGFAVLRGAAMPAVLCELGFITNAQDLARMTQSDYPSDIARAIVKGLKVFLNDGQVSQKP